MHAATRQLQLTFGLGLCQGHHGGAEGVVFLDPQVDQTLDLPDLVWSHAAG